MNQTRSAETGNMEFERRLGDGPWANAWCPTWEPGQDRSSEVCGAVVEHQSAAGAEGRIWFGSSLARPTVGAGWTRKR